MFTVYIADIVQEQIHQGKPPGAGHNFIFQRRCRTLEISFDPGRGYNFSYRNKIIRS